MRSFAERELQILSLLSEGKPYAQIASDPHVSSKTIVNTGSQLMGKLGVRFLPELTRIAIEHLPSMPNRAAKE